MLAVGTKLVLRQFSSNARCSSILLWVYQYQLFYAYSPPVSVLRTYQASPLRCRTGQYFCHTYWTVLKCGFFTQYTILALTLASAKSFQCCGAIDTRNAAIAVALSSPILFIFALIGQHGVILTQRYVKLNWLVRARPYRHANILCSLESVIAGCRRHRVLMRSRPRASV